MQLRKKIAYATYSENCKKELKICILRGLNLDDKIYALTSPNFFNRNPIGVAAISTFILCSG